MARCPLCDRRSQEPASFCASCTDQLTELGGGHAYVPRLDAAVPFTWPYTGIARSVILAIKASGRERVAVALWAFLMKERRASMARFNADTYAGVMPCPSSLWGRLRGRLDVAGWLAYHIAREGQLPLLAPPMALRFRLKKRARLGKKTAPTATQPCFAGYDGTARNALDLDQPNKVKPILLVDDVLTTGQTMAEVASYQPNLRYYALALA